MKLKIAEEELAALSVSGSSWASWQSPMSGVTLIDRHASTSKILMQVALFPIASILILILALMAPFDYMAHLRNVARKRAALTDEMRRLIASALPMDDPSVRTLRDMWSLCGIANAALHPSAQLDLLCEWVDVIYAPGFAAELKLRERVNDIGRRMSEANRPYFDGQKEAVHYYFGPPIDALIEELSEELPPFRGAPA